MVAGILRDLGLDKLLVWLITLNEEEKTPQSQTSARCRVELLLVTGMFVSNHPENTSV